MTGDVCACGLCDVEACDLCASPVAFLDEDGEAWCAACWSRYEENRAEAAWLRQWEASQ